MREETDNRMDRSAWHASSADDVLREVGGTREGLSQSEAERRLAQDGPNRLTPPARRGPLVRFLLQFHNVLIYVLLVAAAITALLAHWVDTGVILGVVVLNALIGFIQEGKAERALDAIRGMLSLHATVLRGGHRREIEAEDLVRGDIVLLRSGDKVPADLRLIHVRNLEIDEAALTGESVAAEKDVTPVLAEAALGDRSSMAYSGTLVTYGQGTGVVIATGDATEIGRISSMLAEVRELTTPLLRQMSAFGRWLTAAILVLAGFTFAFGLLVQEYAPGEMFLAAVGLAVAAIPEGLPAIMTITLAIGVQRMAGRNAIIRRLPAVETLGAVTVICSDKTGTLTRNEMTARTVVAAENVYDVAGAGYDPHGAFDIDGREIDPAEDAVLLQIARAAVLCNDAHLRQSDDAWVLEGAPTEGALLTVAAKAGLDEQGERERFPRTDAIPFESQHRFMATLHHDHEGRGMIYVKGAPERLLDMCAWELTGNGEVPLEAAKWQRHVEALGAQAQRVLAVACKKGVAGQTELRFEDVDGDLTLLGLFGLIDPPREEAIAAIEHCQQAGIRVKMITGDHAVTARAIAAQLHLANDRDTITGPDLDRLDDAALLERVTQVDVFARSSPEHKLRLVEALQNCRQVVAMTGDGVNDAPALKRADVGVAMGRKGTEAAKEAAEMVLADDNFASIAHAVEEGRAVYANLQKAILFILPTNGGEALTIVSAILLGRSLPITAVQILWVNMITAVTLALALAFEPIERGTMRRPPRRPDAPILSPALFFRFVYVSLILVGGTFGLFLWERAQGESLEVARTVAVNTLVMFEAFYLLNARFLNEPSYTRNGLFGSRPVLLAIGLVLVFQLLFTYLPVMQVLFETAAIDVAAWIRIVAVAATVFLAVEAEKAIRRRARTGAA
ncbi:cation-transporting P-type ATPase [Candidatus Binatia bacterium]|nr:cation-transporting P-type ATPase [Candidatus Binatia bacterium]